MKKRKKIRHDSGKPKPPPQTELEKTLESQTRRIRFRDRMGVWRDVPLNEADAETKKRAEGFTTDQLRQIFKRMHEGE